MPNESSSELHEGFISEQIGEFLEHPIRKPVVIALNAVVALYGVHLMHDVVAPRVEQAVSKVSGMIVKRFNSGE